MPSRQPEAGGGVVGITIGCVVLRIEAVNRHRVLEDIDQPAIFSI